MVLGPKGMLRTSGVPIDVSHPSLVRDMIEQGRYGSAYEPIIDLATGEIFGFEALARFELFQEPIAPDTFFSALHTDPTLFFMLERRIKEFQLQHRPDEGVLFVNLDPDVCKLDYQVHSWCELLAEPSKPVVVEIIENTTTSNLTTIRRFIQMFRTVGIPTALDDIGGACNLFSFELLSQCAYAKFDRRWLKLFREDSAWKEVFKGMVAFMAHRGAKSVIEGLESAEDLALAKQLGVDFGQGYYYRPQFQAVWAKQRLAIGT